MSSKNPCTRTRTDADNLLKDLLTKLENTPRDLRTNSDYVERNVLNYSWLLQTLHGPIDTQRIEKLVGESLQLLSQQYIRSLVFGGYATQINRGTLGSRNTPLNNSGLCIIKLCDPIYEAITDQLNSPAMYNDMLRSRNLLSGLSGTDLLSLLIQPQNTDLITTIASSIEYALGINVNSRHLNEIPELGGSHVLGLDLANYTRIVTNPSGWSFILCAYPS